MEIRNTLYEAINILEEEGHKLKAIINREIDKGRLTPIRMKVLNQKNKLIELDDLMKEVLKKEEKEDQSIN